MSKPTSGTQATLGIAHPINQCRLYYSSYTPSPSYGLNLLQEPQKMVEFEQYQYVQFSGIQPGASIQRIILSSCVNCKGILIIPMVDASQMLNGISAPLHSFCTEPSTPSAAGYLQNFNLMIGGAPLYPESKGPFETQIWLDELSEFGINGGHELGVSSSLFNQYSFEQGLRYYWCNTERVFSDSRTPQSISMTGVSASLIPLTLHVFVIQKQSVLVNISTGKIVTGTA